ncbi:MAG: arginine--tRNA ligase [Flavobacteriales bacterium]|nr:arginine--tRNA ligase [Flavobacteriales bacterium]
MQHVAATLLQSIQRVIQQLYNANLHEEQLQLQKTRKEFEGDVTLVVFPLLRTSKVSPEETGKQIGEALVAAVDYVESFNVVKGFLNVSFTANYWVEKLGEMQATENYGFRSKGEHSRNVMVEYSSPNTNKPLHLGHIRNNLLGYSVAEILKANGHTVQKVQVINDRGIHICKSMLAWQKFGNGETPQSSGLKGDKLVGKYYVEFDKRYKVQIAELIEAGKTEKEAEAEASIMMEAREMLLKWEADDVEVRQLWATMNGWVYEGFDQTYNRLGVDFDKLYYESNTYLIGKELVESGVEEGILEKREDGSIWCDLTADGMDQKLLLRSDGTAVYMTQDLGTAKLRYTDWPSLNQLIYTVGNEQDYHFKVLFLILGKLGFEWAQNCYHLSYGMVDLPSGKMKSREGTVVDADDLMEEMVATAKAQSEEKGKLEGMVSEEAEALFEMLGMGALKYFMLKVDPKKRMLFNPAESIDMQGNTGPFIQYTHARIKSVLRKAEDAGARLLLAPEPIISINENERSLIRLLNQYPETVKLAGDEYSPAIIANYAYELAKEYNTFYHECPILVEEDENKKALRLVISGLTSQVIASAMRLLGVTVPDRM